MSVFCLFVEPDLIHDGVDKWLSVTPMTRQTDCLLSLNKRKIATLRLERSSHEGSPSLESDAGQGGESLTDNQELFVENVCQFFTEISEL